MINHIKMNVVKKLVLLMPRLKERPFELHIYVLRCSEYFFVLIFNWSNPGSLIAKDFLGLFIFLVT